MLPVSVLLTRPQRYSLLQYQSHEAAAAALLCLFVHVCYSLALVSYHSGEFHQVCRLALMVGGDRWEQECILAAAQQLACHTT